MFTELRLKIVGVWIDTWDEPATDQPGLGTLRLGSVGAGDVSAKEGMLRAS
jgi:hypothetical protein